MNKNIKLDDEQLRLEIHFYGDNHMPAIMAFDEDGSLYGTLTTNLNKHIPKAISIRSDEVHYRNALIDNRWIKEETIYEQPSGFISIQYYELTDDAYDAVLDAAKTQGIEYPINW